MQNPDELEILLGSLYAVSELTDFEEEKKKLRTGHVHAIPFFLQERENIPLGLVFRERFGPYSQILQNNLELAVDSGLIKSQEKELPAGSFKIADDIYWISPKGKKYFEKIYKERMSNILGKTKEVAEYVIKSEYWMLVGEVIELWDKNARLALNLGRTGD